MRKILCTVHQGQFSGAQLRELEGALKSRYAEQFGGVRAVLIWCELPQGQGFTEGRPSDVSFAMVEVPDGLDQATREAAMLALASEFARVANVGIDKLTITLADSTLFDAYLAANRARIRPLSRPWFLASTLLHLWRSRRRHGYLAIKANL